MDLHGPYIKGCTTAFDPVNGCYGEQAQDPFKVTTQMLVNQSIWPPWGRSGPIGAGLKGTAFSEYGFTVCSSTPTQRAYPPLCPARVTLSFATFALMQALFYSCAESITYTIAHHPHY